MENIIDDEQEDLRPFGFTKFNNRDSIELKGLTGKLNETFLGEEPSSKDITNLEDVYELRNSLAELKKVLINT